MAKTNSIQFAKEELDEYKKSYNNANKFRTKLSQTLASTTKQLIWVFTINGILWIWCSYVLAFTGHEQIAEALSSNVCSVVIGQIGFYLVTKTIENLSKFNPILNGSIGFKKPNEADSECDHMYSDIPEDVEEPFT